MRQDPKQIFGAYAFAINSEAGSLAALRAAAEPHGGRCPDAVFLCAGASRPGFFIDQTEESFRAGVEMTFGAQAFTALVSCIPYSYVPYASLKVSLSPFRHAPLPHPYPHPQATTKEMVKQGVKGKIVFVASVLGLMSFVGYTPYTPGKFAIRGEP